jgi:hypothetical protein
MPGAASFLAIAAFAMVLENGFAARFITDRAARASAGARDQADFGLARRSIQGQDLAPEPRL